MPSDALMVNGKVPVCVGVPVIVTEVENVVKASPVGNVPVCESSGRPVAPTSVKVAEYGTL